MPIDEPDLRQDASVPQSRLTPRQTLGLTSLLVGAIFLLDVFTAPHVDIPILYVFVLLLCLHYPWRSAPVVLTAVVIVLTFVPPTVLWQSPFDWSIVVNRAITVVALGATGLLLSARQAADTTVRESRNELERRVEERTAQLRDANRTLESEITTRREAEQLLKASQERLARTEDVSLVMVTHVGLDGRWLKIPGRLCRLLGYSEAELLAGTFMDVTHPEDVDADWSQCQRLIRGEIKSFELEKRYIRQDGAIVWVYLNCSGVYDTDGRLIHFLTYIRDISDRKRAEDALRASEEKWRSVIETVPIGIAISTVDGRVLDVNTAAWTMLGYKSKEEFLRLAAESHDLDPIDRQRRIERIRAGHRVFEAQYKKKDGTLFWGRCTAAILGERDGEVLLINAYDDITEQREYHETLQRAKEELQIANRRLTERDQVRTKFLSVVSHELRTPLAAIKGFADNMLKGVTGVLTQRQTGYLERIQSSAERLTRLIGQLLDWSKLEMGAARLVPKPVVMATLIQSVSDHVQFMSSAKQIVVRLQFEPDLPVITADPDNLEQILWNLLGNAIKYTPDNGQVTMDCRRADQEGIILTVSDSGCGIASEDLPKVFEQFSGVHSACPSAKGAQLGLYITKSLVSLHGGRIWVESTLGKGSRFHVYLPLKPPEAG